MKFALSILVLASCLGMCKRIDISTALAALTYTVMRSPVGYSLGNRFGSAAWLSPAPACQRLSARYAIQFHRKYVPLQPRSQSGEQRQPCRSLLPHGRLGLLLVCRARIRSSYMHANKRRVLSVRRSGSPTVSSGAICTCSLTWPPRIRLVKVSSRAL